MQINPAFKPSTFQSYLTISQTGTKVQLITCTAANATAGATYTNNGHQFTVQYTIAGKTYLVCTDDNNAGLTGNTLTKSGGTGDATITFSASQLGWLYIPPSDVVMLRAKISGGGGSGASSAYTGHAGNDGSPGSPGMFAGYICPPGLGGKEGINSNSPGGVGGGTVQTDTGGTVINSSIGQKGGGGGTSTGNVSYSPGGMGAQGLYGGAGNGAYSNDGTDAVPYSGGGGAGGGGYACPSGGGGGSGSWAVVQFVKPFPVLWASCSSAPNGGANVGGPTYNGGKGSESSLLIEELYQPIGF